jgi:UDP-N-acetylenolpyruvoylglucosamine reductase
MAAAIATELDVSTLAAQVRGKLIRPGDEGYEEARKTYNASIDRRPAAIVRSVDVADVIATVSFARENGLELAIRSGAHNVAGFGTTDGGIVLDLSPMKGIQIDQAARTVIAQAGCTWGDVDHATHAFGLAAPGGVVSTTGVGGLTLGGGLGHLTRSCGLAIDNILAADVVLADGSLVTASADENADLYWAIRGGGGNFGVVTSFTFRLHPVDTIVAGPMLWPIEQAAGAMRMWEQLLAGAPDELTGTFVFVVVPPGPPFPKELHGKTMGGVVWCHTGTIEEADEALVPARAFGPPALDLVGPMPHPVLQSLFDELCPSGLYNYWRGDFVDELSDDAIAAYVEHGSQVPNIFSSIHVYPIDGVASRVGADETAFSYRGSRWSQVIFAADPDPAKSDDMRSWTVGTWEALHPFSAGGAYVNFMMDEGQERVQATYRGNYERLAEVKKRYDPTNLFRVNQNIQPAR